MAAMGMLECQVLACKEKKEKFFSYFQAMDHVQQCHLNNEAGIDTMAAMEYECSLTKKCGAKFHSWLAAEAYRGREGKRHAPKKTDGRRYSATQKLQAGLLFEDKMHACIKPCSAPYEPHLKDGVFRPETQRVVDQHPIGARVAVGVVGPLGSRATSRATGTPLSRGVTPSQERRTPVRRSRRGTSSRGSPVRTRSMTRTLEQQEAEDRNREARQRMERLVQAAEANEVMRREAAGRPREVPDGAPAAKRGRPTSTNQRTASSEEPRTPSPPRSKPVPKVKQPAAVPAAVPVAVPAAYSVARRSPTGSRMTPLGDGGSPTREQSPVRMPRNKATEPARKRQRMTRAAMDVEKEEPPLDNEVDQPVPPPVIPPPASPPPASPPPARAAPQSRNESSDEDDLWAVDEVDILPTGGDATMEAEGTDLEEPRLKPTGSSKKKSYTVALKLEAVEYGEQHGKHEAARVFNVDRKLIRTWTSQKAWLQTEPLDATRAGAVGRRRMVQGRKTRRGRPLSGR